MEKETKYRVSASMFKGVSEFEGNIIGYTYEITFNKSLEHTGRFRGIEDGLNDYCRKERKKDIINSAKQLWYSLVKWVSNLFN